MLTLRPLDERVPIQQQLGATATPVVLINVFTVDPADVDALLAAWEHDANWMKRQPGYISTQLHRGIGGSCVFLNYALWESVERFAQAFTHPDFVSALARYPSSAVAQPHLFSRVAVPNLCTA
jgi:heme-degrading monooxygenase HmoA